MNKQRGFTLAEMIISVGIIGILTGAALLTLKPFDKNVKYIYSNTFYSLDKAFYNGMTYWANENNQKSNRDPFISGINNGSQRLCNLLIEYITPVENNDACRANAVTATASDNEFIKDNVQFTATNGVRFFISSIQQGRIQPPSETAIDGEKFYIIYADINGVKAPNSVTYEVTNDRTKDPDIFAFAALESGRICPLGPPEVDIRYMTTRILYKNFWYSKFKR